MVEPKLNREYLGQRLGNDSWVETASASNAPATATHAAAADKIHAIHTIIVDYGDAASDRAIVVKFGGVEQFQFNTEAKRIVNLSIPLRAAENEAISVEAAGGGITITGRVTIIGITIDV